MNTAVMNEDEARSLLIVVNCAIDREIREYVSGKPEEEALDFISDLFSIRRKCMEVVGDG